MPLQQNRYAPVKEFHSKMLLGLLSSCRAVSNTCTLNEQLAVFPEASVAVQVTEVTPVAKQEPEAGVHTTETPGQLSEAVGVVKVTVWHGGAEQAF